MNRSLRLAVVISLLLLPTLIPSERLAAQQSVMIFNVDTSDFPVVEADLYVRGTDGFLLRNLDTSDFSATENGEPTRVLSFTCPPFDTVERLSLVLTLDISGSMDEEVEDRRKKLDVVKEAAIYLIRNLPLDRVECAVTAFHGTSYVVHPFSNDTASLITAIATIPPASSLPTGSTGTDFNAALTAPGTGGLDVAGRALPARTVILITDGEGDADENEILSRADAYDVMVHTITIDRPSTPFMQTLAKNTGGLWFEEVTDVNSLKEIFFTMLQRSLRIYPCHIKWLSKVTCSYDKHFALTYLPINAHGSVRYRAPEILKRRLSITPQSFRFGPVEPGTTVERPFIIVGQKDTITIREVQGISADFTIPELEADPSLFPMTVSAGDTIRLMIRFSPQEEGVKQANLRFITNRCDDPILYCVGGKTPFAPTPSDLRLTHPNGGEVFKVGIDTVITWTGVHPADPVRLEFSIDAGATWKTAAELALALRQDWHVPNTPSNTCLARVTELNSGKIRRTFGQGKRIYDALFTPDGKRLITSDQSGAIKVWDIQTGQVVNQINTAPGGKLALSPDGRMLAVAHGGQMVTIWHVESRSAIALIPYGYGGNAYDHKALLSFTPDGTRLVLTLHEHLRGSPVAHTLMIYNIEEKKIERTIFDRRQFYRHGRFSPDGNYFAITGEGGVIQVWNSAIDTLLYETTDTSGTVRQVEFNHDGTRFYTHAAVDSTGSFLTEWSTESGTPLRRFVLPNILYDFDPGAVDILMTDSLAILRSPEDGTLLGEFSGHVSRTLFSRFSLDESMVVTGGEDGYAIVWDVERGTRPSDRSDSLWAIIAPYLEPVDVDFDSVAVGYDKDSIITGYVLNTGTADAEITSMRIDGKNRRDFRIISGDAPFRLDAGEARPVGIRFTPGDTGIRTAEVTIVASSGTLKAALAGIGVFPDLLGDTIDFLQRGIGTSNDSAGFVVHTGTSRLQVDSIRLAGPNPEQFGVGTFAPSFPLRPGDRLKVPVNFSPTLRGNWQGNVEIFHTGFGSPARVVLLGEGIKEDLPLLLVPHTLTFSLQTCAPAEQRLRLPMYNPGEADLKLTEITLEGDHPDDFTLLEPLPETIPPGDSAEIIVSFLPTDTGNRSAIVRIASNGGNQTETLVELSGRLEVVQLELAEEEIDLGTICRGTETGIGYVLKNTGNRSTTVRVDAELEGPDGTFFLTSPIPFDLASEENHNDQVLLAAGDTRGEIRGSLTFRDTVCGTEQVLTFRGIIDGPDVEIDSVPIICAGAPVRLAARGAERYRWEPSGEIDCSGDPDCAAPLVHPFRTTTYIVTGYDADDCADIDSVTVTVQTEPTEIAVRMGRGHRGGPGDSVKLPILIDPLVDSLTTGGAVTDLEIRLEYDPNVLTLNTDAILHGLAGTRLQGWRVLGIDGSGGHIRLRFESPDGLKADPLLPLLQLEGRIFLANVTGTEVTGTIRSSRSCVAFTPFAGYVTVDSICGLHQRLIDISRAKYSLSPPYPNPVTGDGLTIDFSLGLDGPTTVELVNSADGRSAILLNDHLEPGAYRLTWRTEDQPSGTYLVRVSSGEWNRVEWVRIVR